MPPLDNPKHEAFAQGLFEGKTADQAYIDAGYSENRGNATRLKANESVRLRLLELQSARAEEAGVTVETLQIEFEHDRHLARMLGMPAAAIKATEHIGKLHGVYVERSEKVVNVTYYESLTDDELNAEARRAAETDTRLESARREAAQSRKERPARLH